MQDEAAALRATADDLERRLAIERSPRVCAPLSEALRRLGDTEGALRVARQGVDAFPQHVAIRIALARALADAGLSGEAEDAYREAARLDPGNSEAAAALGEEPSAGEIGEAPESRIPEVGDLAEELADLAELFAPQEDPGSGAEGAAEGIATLTLAEIYARQGLARKAVEVCETVLDRHPDNAEARERLEEYRRMLATVG